MKKLIPAVLAIIIAALVVMEFISSRTIDIIGDLEEVRNTPTEAGQALNQYHANIEAFDFLVSSGDYLAAFSFIDSLIRNDTDYVHRDIYIFEKGKLLYNLEKYVEAKNVLTEAIIQSDSHNLKAFVWRGYSYSLLGSCDSALVDLKFAVSQNSSRQRDYNKVLKFCNEER